MKKSCKECVRYTPPSNASTCGMCNYPVPGWLKHSGSGGFISHAGYEAQDCNVYERRHDAAAMGASDAEL